MAATFVGTVWRKGTGLGSSIAVEAWGDQGGVGYLVYEIARGERQLLGGTFADGVAAIRYARGIVSGKVERPFV